MKKFLTSFAVLAVFALSANAQESSTTNEASVSAQDSSNSGEQNWRNSQAHKNKIAEKRAEASSAEGEERRTKYKFQKAKNGEKATSEDEASRPNREERRDERRAERRDRRQERLENASPEDRARMEKRHDIIKNLPPEKRAAVKAEIERHREAMKQITGAEFPMPDKK